MGSEHGKYLVKTMVNLKHVSYSNIECLANLISSYDKYNPNISTRIVDLVMEKFYRGLLDENPSEHQQRVMMVKFLGELYSFCVVDSSLVFETLYTLINFKEIDPNDCFRIRLVCALVSTCKDYFDKGQVKKNLIDSF